MSRGSRPVFGPKLGRSAESEALADPDDTVPACIITGCRNAASKLLRDKPVQLCSPHAALVVQAALENDEAIQAHRAANPPPDPRHVVYYVRFADHIKIGTTSDLTNRMEGMSLHPDALLAAEPGDRTTERQRHAMFLQERYRRTELFTESPALMDHIHHVRSLFGDPKKYLRR